VKEHEEAGKEQTLKRMRKRQAGATRANVSWAKTIRGCTKQGEHNSSAGCYLRKKEACETEVFSTTAREKARPWILEGEKKRT
jgi:hypothetical protein